MPTLVSTIVFAACSLPIVWVSRRSLLRPACHGFPRFFAFEAVLALLVLNAPAWLAAPLAPRQIVSWLLLLASAVLVIRGVLDLRRGGPRPAEPGSPLFACENTENLVTTGVYRFIRHPMYSSLLFLAWGAMLKVPSVLTVALAGVATAALIATAKIEERENVARFGDEYREYRKRTRLFVPFLL